MPKLIELLQKNKLTLIVELPENSLEIAEAAVSGGADVLQINVSLENLKDQGAENLRAILKQVKLPVGVVLEREKNIEGKEISFIEKLKFDFFNISLEQFSPAVVQAQKTAKVLTLNSRYTLDEIVEISQAKIAALDAAIIPAAEQRRELEVGDLQNYISIILSSGIPVIVPTQLSIRSSEVAIVADTGAKGILLTKVVTGTTAKHVREATLNFRRAIDELAA